MYRGNEHNLVGKMDEKLNEITLVGKMAANQTLNNSITPLVEYINSTWLDLLPSSPSSNMKLYDTYDLEMENNAMSADYPRFNPASECQLFSFVMDTSVLGVLSIAGFCGGVIAFLVLWQEKSHASIMFLLEGLILADLTLIWMVILQDVVPGLAWILPLLQDCTSACHIISRVTRPLLRLSQHCVVWFTVCAAMNRFIITCYPARAGSVCTVLFARRQAAAIITLGVLLSLPLTFDVTLHVPPPDNATASPAVTLFDNNLYQYAYVNGVMFVVVALIPLSVMLYVCCELGKLMNIERRPRRGMGNLYKTQNTEMSQVILTMGITLVVCYIPSVVQTILFWVQSEFDEHCGELNFYLDSFVKFFLVLNSSMKIVIFLLFAQGFPDTLKQTLCSREDNRKEAQIFGMYKCSDMSEMTLMSNVDMA